MTIYGKMVDYISSHKQFDVAFAISSEKIPQFKEQLKKSQRTFGSVGSDVKKSNGTKNTSKTSQDAALLIGVNLSQQYHIRKY